MGLRWLLFKSGIGATNVFEASGFIRTRPGVRYPDVQLDFTPAAVQEFNQVVPGGARLPDPRRADAAGEPGPGGARVGKSG